MRIAEVKAASWTVITPKRGRRRGHGGGARPHTVILPAAGARTTQRCLLLCPAACGFGVCCPRASFDRVPEAVHAVACSICSGCARALQRTGHPCHDYLAQGPPCCECGRCFPTASLRESSVCDRPQV